MNPPIIGIGNAKKQARDQVDARRLQRLHQKTTTMREWQDTLFPLRSWSWHSCTVCKASNTVLQILTNVGFRILFHWLSPMENTCALLVLHRHCWITASINHSNKVPVGLSDVGYEALKVGVGDSMAGYDSIEVFLEDGLSSYIFTLHIA